MIFVGLTLFAVAGLLTAERFESRTAVWVFKPLASTGFLLAAHRAGAFETRYGRILFVGLVLAWLGDVLLIPRHDPRVFRAGVLSFLLGHVAYAAAFWTRGASLLAAVAGVLATTALGVGVLRWLRPHLPDDMRLAASAYVLVISVMVVAAAASVGAAGNAMILAGAVAFYLSDISVARDRFVEHAFINRLWGLPLYYLAQLVLSQTVRVA